MCAKTAQDALLLQHPTPFCYELCVLVVHSTIDSRLKASTATVGVTELPKFTRLSVRPAAAVHRGGTLFAYTSTCVLRTPAAMASRLSSRLITRTSPLHASRLVRSTPGEQRGSLLHGTTYSVPAMSPSRLVEHTNLIQKLSVSWRMSRGISTSTLLRQDGPANSDKPPDYIPVRRQ